MSDRGFGVRYLYHGWDLLAILRLVYVIIVRLGLLFRVDLVCLFFLALGLHLRYRPRECKRVRDERRRSTGAHNQSYEVGAWGETRLQLDFCLPLITGGESSYRG